MEESYTRALADFAADTNFAGLTSEAVSATKRLVLDTLACAIGGYASEMGGVSIQFVRRLGGNPQATVLVAGDKTSVTNAAFANGQLANALDADDILLNAGHHGCVALAAALAMAENCRASGSDFISAVAIGYEVAARIGLSLRRFEVTPQGTLEHAPTTGLSWAVFGAAAAAAKLLGLDRDRMRNALGAAGHLALVPAGGRWLKQKAPRPMTKYVMQGALAEGGTRAALLAKAGFTGDGTVLDGERGFWKLAGALGCNWDFMTAGLGERWLIIEDSFKPYPGCRHTNAPLDLFYRILREHRLNIEEIDKVQVGANPTGFRQGLGDKTVINEIDGQFSIPYLFAVAALGVPPGPRWHTPEMRTNQAVQAFAGKVEVHLEPESPGIVEKQLKEEGFYRECPVSVSVTAGGQTFTAREEYSKGDPWTPESRMSDADLREKFANFSAEILSPDKIDGALEIIDKLEKETSLQRLMSCLTR